MEIWYFCQTCWKDRLIKNDRAGSWFFLYYLERCYFFPENMITFSLGGKWETFFLKKYMEIWSFLCTRASQTWYHASLSKKSRRWSYPAKMHLKVIDVLHWHSGKSSSNSLYFHGVLYRRFHVLLSSEKNRKLNIEDWSTDPERLDFFFNLFSWRYFAMNNLQYFVAFNPQELCFEVCLSANQGNYLSIRRWVIIPKI